MSNLELDTHQKILNAGKKEFLEKGFQGASLRNIVKGAGVTTGAFYGYYKSKKDLFSALVQERFYTFLTKYSQIQKDFANLPFAEQPLQIGEMFDACMDWMIEYIYEYFDIFQLILCCSEGTEYGNLIHRMAKIEVEAMDHFFMVLNDLGRTEKTLDSQLEHILISGLFSAFFEIVIHDMPKEQAIKYVKELRSFYTVGWKQIMGL